VKSLQDAKYHVCFNDDYSKYRRVIFIKLKNEVYKCLDMYLNELSTAGHRVKMFRYYGDISDCVQAVTTEQGWTKQPTQHHTVTRDCMCSNKKLLMMDTVVSETCRAA
jgi:hypothetical protein